PPKSVFGAPATADTNAPAAPMFKSVFGAPATADAKAPAAEPPKSVFGAPATADAKAPAATPFKSVFGAPATADAKAPVATPFKSVFGAPATADTKAPAAAPPKSVFGAPLTDNIRGEVCSSVSGDDGLSGALCNHGSGISVFVPPVIPSMDDVDDVVSSLVCNIRKEIPSLFKIPMVPLNDDTDGFFDNGSKGDENNALDVVKSTESVYDVTTVVSTFQHMLETFRTELISDLKKEFQLVLPPCKEGECDNRTMSLTMRNNARNKTTCGDDAGRLYAMRAHLANAFRKQY
ncbi:uncharacterized protein TM35_000241050, partial [Trypanosoma theileri]